MPARAKAFATYAGWGSVVLTIAGLLVTLGAKSASASLTIDDIRHSYAEMSQKLDKNTAALIELNSQVNLLNYRLARIEEATNKHADKR